MTTGPWPLHGRVGQSGANAPFNRSQQVEHNPILKKLHIELGDYAKILGVDCLIGYGDLMRHAVSSFGNHGFFFKDKLELVHFLKNYIKGKENILIKGSRSMRMEEILNLWK